MYTVAKSINSFNYATSSSNKAGNVEKENTILCIEQFSKVAHSSDNVTQKKFCQGQRELELPAA